MAGERELSSDAPVIWKCPNARLTLLELLSEGTLKRRRIQDEAYDTLSDLPWTRLTGRRNQIELVEARRTELVNLIDRVWPAWRKISAALVAAGLPPTPKGYGRLLDQDRASRMPGLPARINRKTATALTGPDSKAVLTEARLNALGDTDLTHDGSIRLRPPAGLAVRTAKGRVDLSGFATALGEVSIPERAFLDGLVFEGAIRAVLLVENLGAWRDLPALPGWLLAHVPGWDTVTAGHLLDCLADIPVVHFGDLDPNGIRIMLHLRHRAPDLKWFLPDFWFEGLKEFGLRCPWPADIDLDFAPAKVRKLAASGFWLEQERLVLDDRLAGALEETVSL